MKKTIVTVGQLLDKGLIKRSTKVVLTAHDLKDLKLIKPLSKDKVSAITDKDIAERGLIKR